MVKRIFESIADYFRETDKLLLILSIAASCYGAILVLSATMSTSGMNRFYVQCFGILLGVIAAIVISLFDTKTILKLWPFIAAVALGLVALTFTPLGYAPQGTTNQAWLQLPIGDMTFQPSELLKIAFCVTFAKHVSAIPEGKISKPLHVLALCAHGAFPVLLIHFQGDDGSALVIAFIFACMLFASGVKLRYFAIAGGAAIPAAAVLWFFVLNTYQKERFLALFNPSAYPDTFFQQMRGEMAIGSGGWVGQGLFEGPYVQGNKIPFGYNDFIFASAGEELGFLGCMAIMLLLAALCIRILRVSTLSRDKAGMVMCVGVFGMFAAQTILNLGMCLNLLPVIGVTLPFFSAGGTSIACLFLGIGLVLCVYKNRNKRVMRLHD